MSFRIGFGFDVHQLKEGEDFILGGVKLSHHKGPTGHSDADALIHAICDALLGAANLRDIGHHFPDNSADFKNIDSTVLLKRVVALLSECNYKIGNIDSTICLEKPKINPHIKHMQKKLSEVMSLNPDQISIKATTNEKMGFLGREEGIAVHAVALIHS